MVLMARDDRVRRVAGRCATVQRAAAVQCCATVTTSDACSAVPFTNFLAIGRVVGRLNAVGSVAAQYRLVANAVGACSALRLMDRVCSGDEGTLRSARCKVGHPKTGVGRCCWTI